MVGNFLECAVIGSVLGVLSGLGTGGGSLLILWLTLVKSMDALQAKTINLLFFLPSALIASLTHLHQGTLKMEKILPAIIAGSISAGTFAYLSGQWDTQILKKIFGALLILTGIRELLYKPAE